MVSITVESKLYNPNPNSYTISNDILTVYDVKTIDSETGSVINRDIDYRLKSDNNGIYLDFVFISDIHYPLCDNNKLNSIIDFIRRVKPNEIIYGGDIIDKPDDINWYKSLVNSLKEYTDCSIGLGDTHLEQCLYTNYTECNNTKFTKSPILSKTLNNNATFTWNEIAKSIGVDKYYCSKFIYFPLPLYQTNLGTMHGFSTFECKRLNGVRKPIVNCNYSPYIEDYIFRSTKTNEKMPRVVIPFNLIVGHHHRRCHRTVQVKHKQYKFEKHVFINGCLHKGDKAGLIYVKYYYKLLNQDFNGDKFTVNIVEHN